MQTAQAVEQQGLFECFQLAGPKPVLAQGLGSSLALLDMTLLDAVLLRGTLLLATLLLATLLSNALLLATLRAGSRAVDVPKRSPSAVHPRGLLHGVLLDRTLLDARSPFLLTTLLDTAFLLTALLDRALLDVHTTQQPASHQPPRNHPFLDGSLLLAALLDVRAAFLNRITGLLDVALLDVALLSGIFLYPGVATTQCAEQRRRTGFGSGHKQTGNHQQCRQYKTTFHFP
jgi:hypothetical protein